MVKKIQLIFVLLFGIIVQAQSSTASPYSLGALGDVTFRGNAINRIMGGLDVYADSIHANLNNPASLGNLKLSTFSVGVHYRNTELMSNNAQENVTSGSLDYIALSIPTKRFAFSFGLMPYSSVGYQLQSLDDTGENVVLNQYEGSGGLNKTFFTLGFTLIKGWNLGATVNYNFGNINTQSSRQESGIDFGTFLNSESSLSGLDIQLASHIKLQFKKNFAIDLFASYKPEYQLTSKNRRTFFTRSTSTQNIGAIQEVDLSVNNLDEVFLNIGSRYDYGMSIGKDKKWLLGGQYSESQSGNFNNTFIQLNNISYEDANRISIGGFFIPDYSSFSSYWKRMVLRFGFRQETTGIVVKNTSLKETGISFGVGLPLGGYYSATNVAGFSNLNVGLEIGQRGTQDDGLIKENYISLRLGMSLNDLWFIKRVYN